MAAGYHSSRPWVLSSAERTRMTLKPAKQHHAVLICASGEFAEEADADQLASGVFHVLSKATSRLAAATASTSGRRRCILPYCQLKLLPPHLGRLLAPTRDDSRSRTSSPRTRTERDEGRVPIKHSCKSWRMHSFSNRLLHPTGVTGRRASHGFVLQGCLCPGTHVRLRESSIKGCRI